TKRRLQIDRRAVIRNGFRRVAPALKGLSASEERSRRLGRKLESNRVCADGPYPVSMSGKILAHFDIGLCCLLDRFAFRAQWHKQCHWQQKIPDSRPLDAFHVDHRYE